MNELLSAALLVIAATTDSFVVGFNYGVKSVYISVVSNIFIAALCMLGTFVSMLCGKLLAEFLTFAATGLVGGIVLVLLGGYMLMGALDKRTSKKERFSENPEEVDKDRSNVIELRESALIGLLLSLNNMGLGVGAGLACYSVILTPLLCAVFSFTFICAGRALGRLVKNPGLSQFLGVASALLIIALGGVSLISSVI